MRQPPLTRQASEEVIACSSPDLLATVGRSQERMTCLPCTPARTESKVTANDCRAKGILLPCLFVRSMEAHTRVLLTYLLSVYIYIYISIYVCVACISVGQGQCRACNS